MNKPLGWEKAFRDCGVVWQHDGHEQRPYAELTSRLISDTFFDLSFALAFPELLKRAVSSIAVDLRKEFGEAQLENMIICGQMEGSVGIAQALAAEVKAGFMYTTKKPTEGAPKRMVLAPRFEGLHADNKHVLLVEDVVSTASTSAESRDGLKIAGFSSISSRLTTIIDRVPTGEAKGFRVYGVYRPEFEIKTWQRGRNPYTIDGKEIVEPMRPKQKEARYKMRAGYA